MTAEGTACNGAGEAPKAEFPQGKAVPAPPEEKAAAEEGQPRNIVELVVRRRKKTVYEAKAGRLRASNKYLQAGGTI